MLLFSEGARVHPAALRAGDPLHPHPAHHLGHRTPGLPLPKLRLRRPEEARLPRGGALRRAQPRQEEEEPHLAAQPGL